MIGRMRYRDTSLIVQWCSAEAGLFRTIAKGALRPKSDLGTRLDLMVTAEIQWVRSRRSDLHTLTEVRWKKPRLGLRSSYGRLLAATYVTKLVTQVAEAEAPLAGIHALLEKALDHLAEKEPSAALLARFEWRLAQELGVAGERPEGAAAALEEAFHRRLPPQRRQVLEWIRSQSGEADGGAK